MAAKRKAANTNAAPDAPARAPVALAAPAPVAVAAPVPALAPPPAPARVRRLPARRISAEVVKAETRLLDLDRRRSESLEHHERSWADKRAALMASLPKDVLAALEAMGIIDKANGGSVGDPDNPPPPAGTKGAAAPAQKANEAFPPPAASTPAAAPADLPGLVDVERLGQMLAEVSGAWADEAYPEKIIAEWNEAQRRSAFTWADAVLGDGDMRVQANPPPHTLIGRQPGDEG
jgi:hypothetical protein